MRLSGVPRSRDLQYTAGAASHYLVRAAAADGGERRSPLTIAVSRPGEASFRKVFLIRHAEFTGGPGESNKTAVLSYPYAVEHAAKLYVCCPNSVGNPTPVGAGHELWNNGAQLAVIAVTSLAVCERLGRFASHGSRGLLRERFNNDRVDLRSSALPEHHAESFRAPASRVHFFNVDVDGVDTCQSAGDLAVVHVK